MLHCFGAILAWSRRRFWWFAASVDREHTLEGMVRFFEDVGGVAGVMRIDNMGALVARSHPRLVPHPPAREFAAAHGFTFAGCWPGDGARKGKVERPFRELKESFLAEMALDPPGSVAELNARVPGWLDIQVHTRPHRVTGEPPAERLARERPLLVPLPRVRYDTAYREPRRVGRVPLVEWAGAHYSVPPSFAGQLVEVRVEVATAHLEIRAGGQAVARHLLAAPGQAQWDPAHRAAVEAIALGRHRRRGSHLRLAGQGGPLPPCAADLELGPGDYDVAVPDLATRYGLGPQGGEPA